MLLRMLYDDKLAQAAYLFGCQETGESIIIDPQRDVHRYIEAAKQEGLRITAISETHIHADFLSGARQLAEETGARLYLSDEGDADWKYQWLTKKRNGGSYDHVLLHHGDQFLVGNIKFETVHTPGHTPEHICFMVTDLGSSATDPMGLASGDFIFVGDVGRPDLLETAAGLAGVKESSALDLYSSIRWFRTLPDYLQVWPGHGAGSACGKALGAIPQSTVGYEKRTSRALGDATDESTFVESILNGQPEPPLYFARMKRQNKEGPALLARLPRPQPIDATAIDDLVANNVMLVDTRPWSDFAEGHLPGALHAPLNRAFPTVAGSYITPDAAIYLVIEHQDLEEAVTDLVRVGLDNVSGYITPEVQNLHASRVGALRKLQTIEITALKESTPKDTLILDVRGSFEYGAGHLPEALNIAHTRLLDRLEELPKDRQLLVHCQTGGRSAYAAAMLQRYGFPVTMLDGGFLAWQAAGGEVTRETPHHRR